eukprot:scaffold30987_cov24-Prasinocladus_malaysianus.AAC.1
MRRIGTARMDWQQGWHNAEEQSSLVNKLRSQLAQLDKAEAFYPASRRFNPGWGSREVVP